MGLVNSALQIGRSALETYQSALQVMGNNVGNAGNEDYTRQTAGLSAVSGTPLPQGMQPGAGVALNELKRNLDESLENRLRAAIGNLESAETQQLSLGRVEALFDESTGVGVANRLNEFFNSFSDVQNYPADLAMREITLAEGADLTRSLSQLREELQALAEDLDDQIGDLVIQADELATQIAALNSEITAAEAGLPSSANALRDQRDALVRDLSEIFDVTVRHQPDGSTYVYVGSEPLVMGGVSRGLTTRQTADGEFARTVVHFADGSAAGSPVSVRGGQLGGLIAARDTQVSGPIDGLDELAAALIFEVNRLHADGQGTEGFSSLTGTYKVQDTTAALTSDDAGLLFSPRNGSFFIAVADDATGTALAYQIDVDLDGIGDDTSLESLVAGINDAVSGVTASITVDNRLSLAADTGYTFSFGHDGEQAREDTSDVLAVLGVNTFFEGTSAADIAVREDLSSSPARLAAATVGFDGDGSNAGRLAELATQAVDTLGGLSLTERYRQVANDVAVAGATVNADVEAAGAVLAALQAQKESISGVSLDEEALEMLKLERAYQGAARYVVTVDQMMSELLALVR